MKKLSGDPKLGGLFLAFFLFCLAISLGVLGVLVWAVIRLVVHFTGG